MKISREACDKLEGLVKFWAKRETETLSEAGHIQQCINDLMFTYEQMEIEDTCEHKNVKRYNLFSWVCEDCNVLFPDPPNTGG